MLVDAERCEEMELLMRAKYTENSCIVNELTSHTDLEMMFVNQRRKNGEEQTAKNSNWESWAQFTPLMTHTQPWQLLRRGYRYCCSHFEGRLRNDEISLDIELIGARMQSSAVSWE